MGVKGRPKNQLLAEDAAKHGRTLAQSARFLLASALRGTNP